MFNLSNEEFGLLEKWELLGEYDNIIDIEGHRNESCLKCGKVEPEMLKIGCFIMCPKCKDEEFNNITGIVPESPTGEIYYKWVKKYRES